MTEFRFTGEQDYAAMQCTSHHKEGQLFVNRKHRNGQSWLVPCVQLVQLIMIYKQPLFIHGDLPSPFFLMHVYNVHPCYGNRLYPCTHPPIHPSINSSIHLTIQCSCQNVLICLYYNQVVSPSVHPPSIHPSLHPWAHPSIPLFLHHDYST